MEQSETSVPRLVKDLHFDVLKDLFNLLNHESPITSDWRTFASELGLSYDDIRVLEGERNPARTILENYMTQDGEKTVSYLIDVFKRMKRFDAARVLEKHEFTADESDSALQPAATAIRSGDESHHALQPVATAISSGDESHSVLQPAPTAINSEGFHGGATANEADKDQRIVQLFVQYAEAMSKNSSVLSKNSSVFFERYSFKTLHLLKHDKASIHIESSVDMINFNKFVEELTERNFISFLNSMELKCYILPSSETADVNFLRSLPHFDSIYFSTIRNISNEFCQKLLETFQENTIYTRSIFLSECDLETSESSGVIAELATLIPEVHLWGVNYHCKILDEILKRAKRGSDTKLSELFVDTDKEGKEWKDFIAAISESPIKIKLYGKFHFENY